MAPFGNLCRALNCCSLVHNDSNYSQYCDYFLLRNGIPLACDRTIDQRLSSTYLRAKVHGNSVWHSLLFTPIGKFRWSISWWSFVRHVKQLHNGLVDRNSSRCILLVNSLTRKGRIQTNEARTVPCMTVMLKWGSQLERDIAGVA